MANKDETRSEQILSHLKNHRVLSPMIAAGVIVFWLSQFTTSLDTLRRFVGLGTGPNLTGEYCTLLVPLMVQLDRTKDAFDRWKDRNLPLESQTIRDGNLKARDLLEKHGQLVPPEFQEPRRRLIEHYDRWLEEYQKLREDTKSNEPFVFVGPKGFPFPADVEARFRARLEYVRAQLGDHPACP